MESQTPGNVSGVLSVGLDPVCIGNAHGSRRVDDAFDAVVVRVHSHSSYAVFVIRDHPSLIADSSYSVTRAMNPTCLIERYNEGWVTVLRADMESPSVKEPPDYSLIVA